LGLINNENSGSKAFILNYSVGSTENELQEVAETKKGKITFFTFIVNVGGDINETFAVATPSKPGRHWTLL